MAKSSTNVSDPKTTSIENLARTRDQILSSYPAEAQSVLLDNLYAPDEKLLGIASEKGINIKKFLDDRDALVNLVKKQTEMGQAAPEEKPEEKEKHEQDQHIQRQRSPEKKNETHADNQSKEAAETLRPIDQTTELENQLRTGGAELDRLYHTKGTRDLNKIRAKEEELSRLEETRNEFLSSRPQPLKTETPPAPTAPRTPEPPSTRRLSTPSFRVPNFGLQKRGISGLNSGARIVRGAGRGTTRVAGRASATVAKFGVRLLTSPAGLAILLVAGVIIFVIFFILLFSRSDAPPPSSAACATVPGASCQPLGVTCPIVNGEQTVADVSGRYTCSSLPGAATSGGQPAQTCCLPPSRPGVFIPPFGDCSKTYGGRNYANHSAYSVDFDRIPGTGDITGDIIVSSINGVVKEIVEYNGQLTIVDNNNEYSVLYAHMKNIGRYVSENQNVLAGQIIGEADNTADCHPPICYAGFLPDYCRSCSTGSHLHYQQRLNGDAIQMTFNGIPYPVSTNPSTRIPISHPVTCNGIL